MPTNEKNPFTIELKSAHVVSAGNHIMINLTTKETTHAHSIIYEDYLKKKKSSNIHQVGLE